LEDLVVLLVGLLLLALIFFVLPIAGLIQFYRFLGGTRRGIPPFTFRYNDKPAVSFSAVRSTDKTSNTSKISVSSIAWRPYGKQNGNPWHSNAADSLFDRFPRGVSETL
jgi:hypothetical protein